MIEEEAPPMPQAWMSNEDVDAPSDTISVESHGIYYELVNDAYVQRSRLPLAARATFMRDIRDEGDDQFQSMVASMVHDESVTNKVFVNCAFLKFMSLDKLFEFPLLESVTQIVIARMNNPKDLLPIFKKIHGFPYMVIICKNHEDSSVYRELYRRACVTLHVVKSREFPTFVIYAQNDLRFVDNNGSYLINPKLGSVGSYAEISPKKPITFHYDTGGQFEIQNYHCCCFEVEDEVEE